jgi:hypothetical protein
MNETVSRIYDSRLDVWGLPQVYKNLEVFPIKIKDINYQYLLYKVFGQPKNYLHEKEIIKMSYLKFVLFLLQEKMNPGGSDMMGDLIALLQYCLKKEDISIDVIERSTEGDLQTRFEVRIFIDGLMFTEEDFDNLREIILEQNGIGIDYIEDYDPYLEEMLDFVNKHNKGISFADTVFAFCSILNKTVQEIENYTLYQFKYHMEKVFILEEFELYKPLEASGQIKLKSGEIKSYLSASTKTGRYASVLIEKDKFIEESDIFKASKN